MRKFLRSVSLLLTIVMVIGLFAGCSNSDTESTDGTEKQTEKKTEKQTEKQTEAKGPEGIVAEITVQVETNWVEYYQAAIDRVLAENPEAKISIIETASFDHLDVLTQTDVTNEDVADVFALPADRLYGLAQSEALAGMDAKTMANNVGGFDDYDAGLGGNFNYEGDYLAFPMNIETLINFTNTANAAAAGIDLSKTIEFTELGYEDMLVPVFNAWFGVAMTNSADIEFLGKNDDGTLYSDLTKDFDDLTADQQALFTALFNYWKMHDEAGTDLWDSSAAWGYMDSSYSTGGTNTIRLEGPWSTGGLSEKAGNGADLGIMPINKVTINGLPLAHWKGGWGLAINARVEENADQMALAQKLIEEIINPEYAVEFFDATGKILENVSPDTYASSDLSDVDKQVVAAVIESYKDAPARPLYSEWNQVWGTWEGAMLSWAAVKPTNVEEAYAQVKAAFDAMMLNF